MELIHHSLPPDTNLYLSGDWHFGNALQHLNGFREMRERVMEDKKAFLFGMGDVADAITYKDKRYRPETVQGNVIQQYKKAQKELQPIADAKKLLGILEGNHDTKIEDVGSILKEYLCPDLKVPYGNTVSKLLIKNKSGKVQMRVFLTHMIKSINSTADDVRRRKTNMELILKRRLRELAGDSILLAAAHSHRLLVCDPVTVLYLYDDGKDIKQGYFKNADSTRYIHPDHRYYVNTGSFLKNQAIGISSYTERGTFDPVELGYIVARIRDYKLVGCERIVV